MPLSVSIVTACKNSVETLEGCLKSAIAQSRVLEHVVIDGGSDDGSVAIVEQYRDSLGHFVSEPDLGLYDALNKGILRASGEVVGILNSDDCFADNRVVDDVMSIFENVECDAVYGDLEYVDANNEQKITRRWSAGLCSTAKMYNGWMPPHPTFFVRRACFQKYGNYRLDMGTAADYELILRFLLVHKLRVRYLPRVLVRMRSGGASNSSLRARLEANRMDRMAWKVNGLRPYPWTLVAKPLRKIGQWWAR